MTDHSADQRPSPGKGKVPPARQELTELLLDTRNYRNSEKYLAMLKFAGRMKHLAPYNAMLLQVQKPGIQYAASAAHWRDNFNRTVKAGARPLLILRPMGPVLPVYDVVDTDGDELPEGVLAFTATGTVTDDHLAATRDRVEWDETDWHEFDGGDGQAGYICVRTTEVPTGNRWFRLGLNRNHPSVVKLTTVAHELAHLYLGHLGGEHRLAIRPRRETLTHAQMELEAESAAYIACLRHGIVPSSANYLANYVNENPTIDDIDIHRVMSVAGLVAFKIAPR